MVEAIPRLDGAHVAFVVPQVTSRYVEGLVTRAEELGVADRVHLLPYVPHDQVVAFLASADAGVIPIHHWPNHEIALITKFFEYAHARLPMIVSDMKAMAQATRSLGQGEVFRADDVEDFVRVVKIVLADPARYRAAYDRSDVLENWTWANQAKVLDGVYRRLLPDHPTDPQQSFRTQAPDVTVIMAVRDAMPYLTRCIRSLLDQTIGLGRMEVIAVDNGSTDGSRERLASFVRRYPRTFTLIRRGGVGGAAASINRALDQATGRYVLVLGATDYLGVEALARLVVAADEHGADVVVPRTVGRDDDGGPGDDRARLDGADAAPGDGSGPVPLPVAVAGARLFRRQLIEAHRLRFQEDLAYGGDQPFAIEACVRATRIRAVADYDHYHVVTPREPVPGPPLGPEERLLCIERILAVTAELLEPGPARDEVNHRRFASDLSGLLQADFVDLDRPAQENLCARIGRLVDHYLTHALAGQLEPGVRLRLWLARNDRVDELLAVIAHDAAPAPPPIVADGGRLYLGHYGFRDLRLLLPDSLFRLTTTAATAVASRLEVISVGWERMETSPHLTLAVHGPFDLTEIGAGHPQVTVGGVAAQVSVAAAGNDVGTVLRVRIAVEALLAQCPPDGERWEHWPVRLRLDLGDFTGEAQLRVADDAAVSARIAWRGGRPYRINPRSEADRRLIVHIGPVTPRRVLQRLIRTVRSL